MTDYDIIMVKYHKANTMLFKYVGLPSIIAIICMVTSIVIQNLLIFFLFLSILGYLLLFTGYWLRKADVIIYGEGIDYV